MLMSMRLSLPILVLLTTSAWAVDTAPLPVLRVLDGDTFEVAADLGGQALAARVRLVYVDCPELPDGHPARDALTALLPVGTRVVLTAPGERFERDATNCILALVTLSESKDTGTTINARMIRAGWSPYWRKDGDANPDLHAKLQSAEAEADKAGAGSWATSRQWMLDKAKERTPPSPSERAPEAPNP